MPQWRSMCWVRGGCENRRGGHDHAPAERRTRLAWEAMSRMDDCDSHPSSCAVDLLSWLGDLEMRWLNAE